MVVGLSGDTLVWTLVSGCFFLTKQQKYTVINADAEIPLKTCDSSQFQKRTEFPLGALTHAVPLSFYTKHSTMHLQHITACQLTCWPTNHLIRVSLGQKVVASTFSGSSTNVTVTYNITAQSWWWWWQWLTARAPSLAVCTSLEF